MPDRTHDAAFVAGLLGAAERALQEAAEPAPLPTPEERGSACAYLVALAHGKSEAEAAREAGREWRHADALAATRPVSELAWERRQRCDYMESMAEQLRMAAKCIQEGIRMNMRPFTRSELKRLAERARAASSAEDAAERAAWEDLATTCNRLYSILGLKKKLSENVKIPT